MSGRKAKAMRKANPSKPSVPEDASFVPGDDVVTYLRNFFRRFAGYNFVSLSRPDKEGRAEIVMHKTIPAMDANGVYASPSCIPLLVTKVSRPDFEGLVVDKAGHGFFGDPFRPITESKVPAIGTGDPEIQDLPDAP